MKTFFTPTLYNITFYCKSKEILMKNVRLFGGHSKKFQVISEKYGIC